MHVDTPRVARSAPLAGALGLWTSLVVVALSGCSSSSSAACAPSGTLTVQVTDESVDNPSNYICNATVTLSSGGGRPTTLTPVGTDGAVANCIYTINEPPGTYTLMASKQGYTPLSETETLTEVHCVTGSVTVRIGLFETQMGLYDGGGLPDASVIRPNDAGFQTFDAGVDAGQPRDADPTG